MNTVDYFSHSSRPPLVCAESADCNGEIYAYAAKIEASTQLIRLGGRASLVSQVTGLEKKTVKRLYIQLQGKPSPSGQTPFSDAWYKDEDQRMLQADLVWRLFERIDPQQTRSAWVLITLFRAYTQIVDEPLLDLARVEFIPRLVAMGLWHARGCQFCGLSYVGPVDSNSIACPSCRLYHRHRCYKCHVSLVPAPKGRPCTRCSHCGSTLKPGVQQ